MSRALFRRVFRCRAREGGQGLDSGTHIRYIMQPTVPHPRYFFSHIVYLSLAHCLPISCMCFYSIPAARLWCDIGCGKTKVAHASEQGMIICDKGHSYIVTRGWIIRLLLQYTTASRQSVCVWLITSADEVATAGCGPYLVLLSTCHWLL